MNVFVFWKVSWLNWDVIRWLNSVDNLYSFWFVMVFVRD